MTCSKDEIIEVRRGIETNLDDTLDPEGRVLVTRHGEFTCINMYLPNGSSSPERQHYKDIWLEDMLVWSQSFLADSKPSLLCGDLNIAHTENDIWNPSGNRRTSGFLDHERSGSTDCCNPVGKILLEYNMAVSKVHIHGGRTEEGRELDRGWRIDYILANPAAADRFVRAEVIREGGLRISDHAPVMLTL